MEDVGLEPLLNIPNVVCYQLHHILQIGTNVVPTSEPSSPQISLVACYEMAISQALNNCNPTLQYMAAAAEFESTMDESKSSVLPLHHAAIYLA